MPISIVVGGQFGSEGKGKVAHYLAKTQKASVAVRCGGTNSGHTVIDEQGETHVFRQLPTAAILPDVKLALCSGSYIDIDILEEELSRVDGGTDRLTIDPFAVIITDSHKAVENNSGLVNQIGSTGSGTGAAVIDRIQRKQSTLFAKDVPSLSKYIQGTVENLRKRLTKGQRIILEGTQGFGLSPFHSSFNPYATSRDTTAAGFLSEVGLSPFDVDDVIMVIRSFPIRVGGNSGPLPNEIDWETVSRECKTPGLCERTSVTKHIRRVGRFDPEIVKCAIRANNPSTIVLNHLDHISKDNQDCSNFISYVEKSIQATVNYAGYSQKTIRSINKDQAKEGR